MGLERITTGVCLGAIVAAGGCATKPEGYRGQGAPAAVQSARVKAGGIPIDSPILTTQEQVFEVARGFDSKFYRGLVGAIPPTGSTPIVLGIAAFDVTDGGSSGPSAGQASLQLESGWGYVVSPPRWPIVRSPRKRGGVRASEFTMPIPSGSRSYVLASCSGSVDRLIYFGTFDSSGARLDWVTLKVEPTFPYSMATCPPLSPGEFAQTVLDPATGTWGAIEKGVLNDVSCPPEVTALVTYVQGRAALYNIPWPPPSGGITPP